MRAYCYICINKLKYYMKDLNVTTQGIKGCNLKPQKLGYVNISADHELVLVVDNFYENSYEQREEPIIRIYDDIDKNELIFSGTHSQLAEILKKSLQS